MFNETMTEEFPLGLLDEFGLATDEEIQTDRAVAANARYATSLGWQRYYDQIARFLGFTNMTPAAPLFAEAVAGWQLSQGISPADGIIGPRTWAQLRIALSSLDASRNVSPGVGSARPPAPGMSAGYLKNSPDLRTVALAAVPQISVLQHWNAARKAIANTYNRLGGLIRAVANTVQVSAHPVLAVWHVESGGRTHVVNRALIRFENHLLFRMWGRQNPSYGLYFRHGGFGGVQGRPWENHQFRENPLGPFQPTHQGQDVEYRVLSLATRLSNEDIALSCISIGGPQILIAHYNDIGYSSPRTMFDAFQSGERAHVLGFFDFCRQKRAPERGDLLNHMRNRNWGQFAHYYNGPGQVPNYSSSIARANDEARWLLGDEQV